MYLVRDIFNTKPGKAKELVAKFKIAMPLFASIGAPPVRIMTDTVANYWTVVIESEVENLQTFFDMMRTPPPPEAAKAMEGYMDLVNGGRREIFKIE
jgi:hypothetical protein